MRGILAVCALAALTTVAPARAARGPERPTSSPEAVASARAILDEALSTLQSVKEGYKRSNRLRQIIDLRIRAGANARRTLEIARMVPEEEARASALTSVAVTLAERDPNAALRVVRGIEKDRYRVGALLRLAVSLDKEQAWEVRLEALDCARRLSDPWLRTEALTDVASALLRTDSARSQAIAEEAFGVALSSEFSRRYLLSIAAGAVARADPDRALQLAHSLDKRHLRDAVLSAIMAAVADKDVDRATQIAHMIEDDRTRAHALKDIASRLSQTDPQAALQVARSVADGAGSRASALSDVAAALRHTAPERSADVAVEALDAAQIVAAHNQHTSPLPYIAGLLAQQDLDGAIQIAYGIADPGTRAKALLYVASFASETDRQVSQMLAQEGVKAAREITDGYSRALMLVDATKVLAKADPDEALDVARSIGLDWARGRAMEAVAREVRNTDPERALRIVLAIEDTQQRDCALRYTIVNPLAGADPGRALQMTQWIEDAYERAGALCDIARSLLTAR